MDNIKNKIKRLLELSNADSNEFANEREQAFTKAQELMQAHNLELADIYQNQHVAPGVIEVYWDVPADNWLNTVLHALAKVYYISTYQVPRGRSQWSPMIVGTPDNVDVAMSMARWLCDSIRKESNKTFSNAHDRKSFRLGAARELYETACKLREQEASASHQKGTNALMVVRNTLEQSNEEFLAKKNLRASRGRGSSVNGFAYEKGKSFGSGLGLNKQIAGSPTKQIGMDK